MRFFRFTPLLMLGACMGATTPAPVVTEAPEPAAATPVLAIEAPVEANEAAPLPAPKPARLSGLNPKQIQSLMGDPSLVRRDGAVQIMLFETSGCVFEVIFYEASLDHHFEAGQVNARNRSGVDMDLQTCLADVLPDGQWLDANTTQR